MQMSGVFISHSSRDDPMATRVRLKLRIALERRGYGVLLDDTRLEPGDMWRPKLYRWLSECAAAVLILTPEALTSPWVRKEATILTWRAALNSSVRVVPVLIGVTKDEVAAAFPAIAVFDHQIVVVDDTGNIKKVLRRVVGAFADISTIDDDKLALWADKLAESLRDVGDTYLSEMARSLAVPSQDWSIGVDGVRTLAHSLLQCAELHDVQTAVQPLLRRVRGQGHFVDLVSPIGVPPETASGILRAFDRPPGQRVIALAGSTFQTAARYVKRATCVAEFYETIETPAAATENSVDALYAAIRMALARGLYYEEADVSDGLAAEESRGRFVQVLRVRAGPEDDGLPLRVLRPLVERLRTELPHLVILILTGAPHPEPNAPYPEPETLGFSQVFFVEPFITTDREKRDNAALGGLRGSVGP